MTFSVDLTLASAGEWFLDGQALKASPVFVIRHDGTRHALTIRCVSASLHGAELKFVANGIESSIRMEVRGRRTSAATPRPLPRGWGGAPGAAACPRAGGLLGGLLEEAGLGRAGWCEALARTGSGLATGREWRRGCRASLFYLPPPLPLLIPSVTLPSCVFISCLSLFPHS